MGFPGRLVIAGLMLFLGLTGTTCFAQSLIPFNFQRLPGADQGNRPNAICNVPGEADVSCNTTYQLSPDSTTAFIQETVTLNGVDYYHIVVGQPEQGFALEYLIETGTRVFFGNVLSDSGGGTCFSNRFMNSDQIAACFLDNNGRQPLLGPNSQTLVDFNNSGNPAAPLTAAQITGNGSGNPNAVIMRQVMTDPAEGFSQEFLKGNFTTKPKISQSITTPEMDSNFVIDMSAIDYNTDTVAADITNTMVLNDPSIPEASRTFDFGRVSGQASISAGRYTYAPAATGGPNYDPSGGYTYWDGGFEVFEVDWESFKDSSQNP